MTRSTLLGKLDRATDKAALIAIQRGMPISVSKKSTAIGNVVIEKTLKNTYNVISLNKNVLYADILTFDIAVIIAQLYNQNDMSSIKKVLSLEETFSKHHLDMIHYLHCIRGAKKRRDLDRIFVLEDKFQLSEMAAKRTRDNLQIYKRVK